MLGLKGEKRKKGLKWSIEAFEMATVLNLPVKHGCSASIATQAATTSILMLHTNLVILHVFIHFTLIICLLIWFLVKSNLNLNLAQESFWEMSQSYRQPSTVLENRNSTANSILNTNNRTSSNNRQSLNISRPTAMTVMSSQSQNSQNSSQNGSSQPQSATQTRSSVVNNDKCKFNWNFEGILGNLFRRDSIPMHLMWWLACCRFQHNQST